MVVSCLLIHCKHHREDVGTLFQLLRVFTARHLTSYHFLATYLENDVAKVSNLFLLRDKIITKYFFQASGQCKCECTEDSRAL